MQKHVTSVKFSNLLLLRFFPIYTFILLILKSSKVQFTLNFNTIYYISCLKPEDKDTVELFPFENFCTICVSLRISCNPSHSAVNHVCYRKGKKQEQRDKRSSMNQDVETLHLTNIACIVITQSHCRHYFLVTGNLQHFILQSMKVVPVYESAVHLSFPRIKSMLCPLSKRTQLYVQSVSR